MTGRALFLVSCVLLQAFLTISILPKSIGMAEAAVVDVEEAEAELFSLRPQTKVPFKKVFHLYATDGAYNGWTSAQRDTFMAAIIDSVGGYGLNLFPVVWNYMCYKDSAAAADSISYRISSGGVRQHKIDINLYDIDDINAAGLCPSGCSQFSLPACCGHGFYRRGSTDIFFPADPDGGSNAPPTVVATRYTFDHELAHLVDAINKYPYSVDFRNTELLSTLAEYVNANRWDYLAHQYFNEIYDAPLMNGSYNPYSDHPYNHYRLFNAYLMSHFSGAADSSDLCYKWVRHTEGGKAVTSLRGLGSKLYSTSYGASVPGSNAVEKFGNLYQRFAIARYANDNTIESGRYGFGTDVDASLTGSLRMFEWPDTNWSRAAVLPPALVLGSAQGDGAPDTLRNWIDPYQPWRSGGVSTSWNGSKYQRPLRVATTGSDYLLFLADSTYFTNTSWDRALSIRVKGTGPRPNGNQTFKISYITYNSFGNPYRRQYTVYESGGDSITFEGSPLLGKQINSVVETVPVTIQADTLNTEFLIPRFGRYNKGVVVVVSMVEEDSLGTSFQAGVVQNYQVIYEFKDTYWDALNVLGTFGPQDSPIHALGQSAFYVGAGSSLTLNSGTTVKFEKNVGTPRLFQVRGMLTANGVTFTSDASSPAKGDWAGISIWNGGGGVNIDNCTIQYADIGIGLGWGGTPGSTGGGTIDACTFNNNSDEDIWINTPDTTIVTGGVITTSSTSSHIGVHIDGSVGPTTVCDVEIIGTSTSGTVGIHCEDNASLLGNYVHDFSSSTGAGVRFDLSDTTIIPVLDNFSTTVTRLYDNYKAIDVAGSARPKIRRARIDDSTYGIYVGTNALPDIGTSTDQGGCDVTDSSNKHVACKTPRLSTLPNVKALYNWWGSSNSADFSSKLSSFADWNPFLGSDPYGSLSARIVGTEETPGAPRVFQNAPNPFSAETTIRLFVPIAGTKLNLRVYDLSGRVVRELANQTASAGEHLYTWDGNDTEGQALPSGVYYYRADIGEFTKTIKLLRVR